MGCCRCSGEVALFISAEGTGRLVAGRGGADSCLACCSCQTIERSLMVNRSFSYVAKRFSERLCILSASVLAFSVHFFISWNRNLLQYAVPGSKGLSIAPSISSDYSDILVCFSYRQGGGGRGVGEGSIDRRVKR